MCEFILKLKQRYAISHSEWLNDIYDYNNRLHFWNSLCLKWIWTPLLHILFYQSSVRLSETAAHTKTQLFCFSQIQSEYDGQRYTDNNVCLPSQV